MKQSKVIKIIDLFSFLALVAMLATGILMEYSLPPQSGKSEIWGLSRHDWGDIHYYGSLLFLVLMSAHLLTHIKYIKAAILGKAEREYKYRIAIGAVGLIALILFTFSLFTAPVEVDSKPRGWQYKTD